LILYASVAHCVKVKAEIPTRVSLLQTEAFKSNGLMPVLQALIVVSFPSLSLLKTNYRQLC